MHNDKWILRKKLESRGYHKIILGHVYIWTFTKKDLLEAIHSTLLSLDKF